MPSYKLPRERKETDEPTVSPDGWERRVSLPVNDEILDALAVGDMVEIKLYGEITETSKHDSPDHESRSITITISQVDAYPEDAEEKFSAGYKRASKHA